jgi:hypothetical protein
MIRRTILSVALVLAGTEAAAQRRPRGQEQGTGLTGEADERFRRGISLAGENNYSAALVEFRRAYDVSRNALILFNVAAMEIELNHFAEGQDALNEYQRSAPAPVVQARRAQIDALQTRIRERSGTITVALPHPGLRVQLQSLAGNSAAIVRERAAASAAIRLPIGRYRVTITATGFRARESEHDVAANSDVRIDAALEAAVATLTIRSNVEGAEVKIDGRTVGMTPLAAQSVPEGERRVEVSRPGYAPFSQTVNAQGSAGVVEANLGWVSPLPADIAARLVLDREYSDVSCFIDDHRVDCGGSDSVPPGRHTLRVTGRDYVRLEQTVQLDAGRATRVDVRLVPSEEAVRESRERGNAQRRTGFLLGGVGLAAAIGGSVWMGLSLADLGETQDAQDGLEGCRAMFMPMQTVDCVNELLDGTGIPPVSNLAQISDISVSLVQSRDDATLQAGLGGGLLGLGVIGITVGAIVIATAPADRFASPPPRRARLAPQFSPTLNGFALRF